MAGTTNAQIVTDLHEYIDAKMKATETNIKLWVVGSVLAQLIMVVIAATPIIFYLGGIYQNANQSMLMLQTQQRELVEQTRRMNQHEQWEMAMEAWAVDQGFKPPKFRTSMREEFLRQAEDQ